MFNYSLTWRMTKMYGKRIITFKNNYSSEANHVIQDSFKRIGGILTKDDKWIFPYELSLRVIESIIHNTCPICGGIVKKSKMLQNAIVTLVYFGGSTKPQYGTANINKVLKCTSCRNSVKYLNPNNHD